MHTWEYNSKLGCYEVTAGMQCDGDGANGQTGGIACYVPKNSKLPSLDLLACAGRPGKWWGIATLSGEEDGQPIVQGKNDPVPGAYVSTTAYQFPKYADGRMMKGGDVNRYLDAAAVKFIVVPELFQKGVPGIVLGCYCEANGVPAIVGDIGPSFGEASIALCRKFDPHASPRGSDISDCIYRVWPGRAVEGYPLIRA